MWRGIAAGLVLILTCASGWAHKLHGLSCRAFSGEFVQLATKGGHRFEVYRTGPPSARIGLLLLPGRVGLGPRTLAWADRVGAQGYRVLTLALGPANRRGHGRRAARERAAIEYLSAPGRKIITFGWGHAGALQSLEASAADPHDVSGTVVCDGGVSAKVALLRRIESKVLLIAFQQTTPLPKLQTFEARMRFYGKPLIVHYYHIDPAAANPTGRHFDSAIAQEVWGQARLFFGQIRFLCRRCAPYPRLLFDYHN
ncbi:hypothetical protein [Acidiferrobacter sp.]|uniref:dienelactone hydrolase family protein n=1 Tax=Acidiferrobacter sp. TaxID=1872107 RepID=UPI002603D235|nr:hypothetical protein [Acidiferrobacter sp.]